MMSFSITYFKFNPSLLEKQCVGLERILQLKNNDNKGAAHNLLLHTTVKLFLHCLLDVLSMVPLCLFY
jgi:hypothetical protein